MSLMRRLREPNMSGVAAVGKASGKVYTQGNIHNVYLRCLTSGGVELTRAQILNDISNIVVKINGEIYIDADATFLLDLQKFYGDCITAGNVNGIIPIPFARKHLATFQERSVTAIGTANVADFSIEVQVIANAQLNQIEIYTEIDNQELRNIGQHIRINKFTRNFAATGLQEIADMPFLDESAIGYMAMHFQTPGSAVVSKYTIKRNNVEIFTDSSPNLNQVALQHAFRKPQTGYYHVDFSISNDLLGILPMPGTRSLVKQITWAAAAPNSFTIYAERMFNKK